MFKWRVATPPPQRKQQSTLALPARIGSPSHWVSSPNESCCSSLAGSTGGFSEISDESYSSRTVHTSDVDLESNMDVRQPDNVLDLEEIAEREFGDFPEDFSNNGANSSFDNGYGPGFANQFGKEYEDPCMGKVDFVDEEDIHEDTPMLPATTPRKLTRIARIDEDDGYGDSLDLSTSKTESIAEEGESEEGRLLRSTSLNKLEGEQESDGTSLTLPSTNGIPYHPGHRFYTPQPAKRKALKPQVSRPPIGRKPQTPPVAESSDLKPKLTIKIPKRPGTFSSGGSDSGIRTASLERSLDSASPSSATPSFKRALKPPNAQPKSNGQKSSVSSTPSTAGSNVFSPVGLRVTPEYADADPIQPKRKAPTKPPLGRRKSDPLSNSRNRRGATENGDIDLGGAGDGSSKNRLTRNQTLEGGISPSDLEKYATQSRHRYFTPQPSRRKFSFRDGQGRKVSGNTTPVASPQHVQHTRSPVARLANQMRSSKQPDRHLSVDAVSPSSSPTGSPVRTPKTPTKSPPAPPAKTAPSEPEPFQLITDEEVLEAHRHVGGRRPRSLSSSAMKRRPLPNVPGRQRSGSTSKIGQDIPTVSENGIRKRRKRQSAPPGRVVSLLSDSNTSLHNTGSPTVSALGEKKRETLREELLRSLVAESASKKKSPLPSKKSGDAGGAEVVTANNLQQVENSLKVTMVRQKSAGYDEADSAPRFSPLPEKHQGYPGSPGTPPTPPSSGGGDSPTGQHPRRRNKPSLSSLVSMPKNLMQSNEILNDILLSERGEHKKLKAIVGFFVGIILGGLLFLGLYYGLAYSLKGAVIITAFSTTFMAMALAFTVPARCVAALMVPIICTSRGRAAFLTFIVTLLLRGPIHNIYLNANEVSDSMSCSAQLAYNQTLEIQEAAQRVLDAYVQGLLESVNQIEDAVRKVEEVFEPIEEGLALINEGVDQAGEALGAAAAACNDIINSAHTSCHTELNSVYFDCQDWIKTNVPNQIQSIGQVCEIFRADVICGFLQIGTICKAPTYVDGLIDNALTQTSDKIQEVVDAFSADVDFSRYFENRVNSSATAEDIQEAIAEELDNAYSYINVILSISDKLLALSFVWVAIKSYMYYTSYRTKDKFDNQYITSQFKHLDKSRRERQMPFILPLKKNERKYLIDSTAIRLSQKEKGYFKFGLSTVVLHSIIAGILMFVDFGLYWLLTKIQEHGDVQINSAGQAGTGVEIGGTGIVADLVRHLYHEGFEATTAFNTSLDTTICLPLGSEPNHNLAIGIGALYLITIVMVLTQAYAQRLLCYIAAYYYPERERERIAFLYGRTLQKRQTLKSLLLDNVRRNKKEIDAYNRISISTYLSLRYPCCERFFKMCGSTNQKQCLGCCSPDDGLMVPCSDRRCEGIYCEECARTLSGICSICENTINMGLEKVPLEDEHKL